MVIVTRMTISIFNFKSIERQFLTIGKDHLILIDGQNGAGKSTVYDAIEWCLYGIRIQTKNKNTYAPIDAVHTRTRVEMEMFDMTIVRRKDPNDLSVTKYNVTYMDDSAQAIIVSTLGSHKVWRATSYLKQKKMHELITGSESDKQQLIYELTFGDDSIIDNNPEYFMNRFRQAIDSEKQCYMKIEAVRNDKINQLNRLSTNLETSVSKTCERDSSDIETSIETLDKNISLNMQILEREEDSYKAMIIASKEKQVVQEDIAEMDMLLSSLPPPIPGAPDTSEIDKVEGYIGCIENIQRINDKLITYDKIDEVQPLYGLIHESYRSGLGNIRLCNVRDVVMTAMIADDERAEAIAHNIQIEKQLKNAYDVSVKRELMSIKIDKWRNYQTAIEAIPDKPDANRSLVTASIASIRKSLTEITCPSCNTSLIMNNNGTLVPGTCTDRTVMETRLVKFIKLMERLDKYDESVKIADALSCAPFHEKLPDEIDVSQLKPRCVPPPPRVNTDRFDNVTLMTSISTDVILTVSNAMKILSQSDIVSALRAELEELKKKKGDRSLPDLRSSLIDLRNTRDRYAAQEVKRETYQNRLSILTDRMLSLPVIGEDNEWTVASIRDSIKTMNIRVRGMYKALDIAKTREDVISRNVHLDNIAKKVIKLEDCLRVAEVTSSDSMSDIISSIESQTNAILADVMDVDNMIVRMKMGKIRRNKASLDISVIHKGIEYTNLSDLSGGEETLLSLSLLLGMGNTADVGFIMLDEALNSLSESMLEKCMTMIERHATNKTVLNVLHLCNKSAYDRVITIE